ncbi:NAD(P)/FAD-dependent oxidoreductase [Enterococcus faecalis]|uniref:NAD(P)/FAD-dependent oxidoreductase n=1 Tax=Enterococcus faecalis TaxID=1351 RepID=UPI00287F66C2|nr:FAD-dependent oxidoreductase [Enterococcus faecalis]
MKKNCLIIGGGFAGLNTAITMSKELDRSYNIFLMDKNDYHLRRVLLFKVATEGKEIRIPFKELLPENVHFIQGELSSINKDENEIWYQGNDDQKEMMKYDKLVLALGSTGKAVSEDYGGISLISIQAAKAIEHSWQNNFGKAKKSTDEFEKKALMSIAIVGAGITGIETATELAYAMKEYARKLGISSDLVSVYLINSHKDIFEQASPNIRKSIRKEIEKCGVTIIDNRKGTSFKNKILSLDKNDEKLSVGEVVWTLGLAVNPIVGILDLPVTSQGKVIVNKNYLADKNIYSIGDCARIVDFKTGKADGMTCKEAVPQAHRLVKILKAELNYKPLPEHKSYTQLFCIGMGPKNGIFWMKIGKRNILLKKRLGWLMRAYTWNSVSFQPGFQI